MTVGGYILMIRSCFDSMEQSICNSESKIGAEIDNLLTELNVNEMTGHCPTGSCHNKTILYAAGILAGGLAIGYLVGQALPFRKARCNHNVKLDSKKIVDTVDVEDIGDKQIYCRCWNSKQFPLCDGSHVAHNERTGDNVGPLIVKNATKTAKS